MPDGMEMEEEEDWRHLMRQLRIPRVTRGRINVWIYMLKE